MWLVRFAENSRSIGLYFVVMRTTKTFCVTVPIELVAEINRAATEQYLLARDMTY